ncbi:hypothetical protein DBR06_SOUSAS7810055, partial [Sousa chinensis]
VLKGEEKKRNKKNFRSDTENENELNADGGDTPPSHLGQGGSSGSSNKRSEPSPVPKPSQTRSRMTHILKLAGEEGAVGDRTAQLHRGYSPRTKGKPHTKTQLALPPT